MEFKDYYAILEIDRRSSTEDIKAAYRNQSKRWHPDLNPGQDVTQKMQDINEAYAMLKDGIKKARYDKEYDTYYCAYRTKQSKEEDSHRQASHQEVHSYSIHDDVLHEDINDARRYAEYLVVEFYKNLKKTSKVAAKGAWDEVKYYLLSGIIISIMAAVVLTCAH